MLINAAFADLGAERFRDAIPRFTEALALGDRGEIRRGLGYAYYRTDNPDQARANLERAVDQGAGDVETYLTLGRIYLDRHDQTHALAMLEKAVAAGADQPGLADTIARLKRDAEAEADYHALGSSHFVIKIEGREDTEAARTVLNALEDAYRRVGARFAYYPLERLEVVLYPDQTFREVTGSPHWSGGIYDGRIKMPIGGLARGSDRLARTVRHEYAHAAIVTLSKGKAPVWLNEGLAQVAEETGDQGRSQPPPHGPRRRQPADAHRPRRRLHALRPRPGEPRILASVLRRQVPARPEGRLQRPPAPRGDGNGGHDRRGVPAGARDAVRGVRAPFPRGARPRRGMNRGPAVVADVAWTARSRRGTGGAERRVPCSSAACLRS